MSHLLQVFKTAFKNYTANFTLSNNRAYENLNTQC